MPSLSLNRHFAIILVLVLAGCAHKSPFESAAGGTSPQGEATRKIQVATTISTLNSFVQGVGGDRVHVQSIVPVGASPETFQPAPQDVTTLSNAQLLVENGAGLETWLDRMLSQSNNASLKRVVCTDGLPVDNANPHLWMDPQLAKRYVFAIRDGLIAVDPAGKEFYETSAAAYLAKLAALDSEIKAAMAAIPPERRKIITTHNAFGYFGDAYGLQFIAPEGLSTSAEPSARDVANIIAQIRTQKIPAVFLENIADPRLLQQIAAETGAKIGGTIYSDSLSPPNGPAATYIDLMRHNAREFQRALTS